MAPNAWRDHEDVTSGALRPRVALGPAERRLLLAVDRGVRRLAGPLVARRLDPRQERDEVLAEHLLDLGLAVAAPQQLLGQLGIHRHVLEADRHVLDAVEVVTDADR